MLFKIRSIRAYLRGDLRSLCTTLWDYFLEFPFLCDLSDTFCLLEVPPFQPSSQKTGPLVSPLCYVFLPGAFVSGAKFYWKTEKNATDIWPMILGPLLLCLKGMIFLPQNFRHLQWLLPPTMGLPGVWDWREWKIIVNLPPLWPLKRVPFSDSWTRRRNLLLALFLPALSCIRSLCAAFWVKVSWLQRDMKKKKPGHTGGQTPRNVTDALVVPWILVFFPSSSPTIYPSEFSRGCSVHCMQGL